MSDYNKLKGFIDEIDGLLSESGCSNPHFKAWRSKVLRFLETRFGGESRYVKDIENLRFQSIYVNSSQDRIAFERDLNTAKEILLTYLDEISEYEPSSTISDQTASFSKVFIVHGHDGELKQTVARIIENQGIEAIILSEKANQGRTIIEKIEDYSDVDGAVCLFTSDDIGKSKRDAADQPRARQNVVLETGYFMGKLGRDHIVILADEGIEMPSDISGVVYTNTANWQIDLLKELKAIGYTVDFNKLF